MEISIFTYLIQFVAVAVIVLSFWGSAPLFDGRRTFFKRLSVRGYLITACGIATAILSILKEVEENKEKKNERAHAAEQTRKTVGEITGAYIKQLINDGKTRHQADSIVNAADQQKLREEIRKQKSAPGERATVEFDFKRDSLTFGKNKVIVTIASKKGPVKDLDLKITTGVYQSGFFWILGKERATFPIEGVLPEYASLEESFITDKLYLLDMYVFRISGNYFDLNTNRRVSYIKYVKLNNKINKIGPLQRGENVLYESLFTTKQPISIKLAIPGESFE